MTTVVFLCSSLLLFSISCLAFTASTNAWVPSLSQLKQNRHTKHGTKTLRKQIFQLGYAEKEYLDGPEGAEPLPLSAFDIQRLTDLKTRGTTMPIVLLESVLPGQKFYFKSSDPKFDELIKYVLTSPNNESDEIGIIGFNPHTGQPLNMGVTAKVRKQDITFGLTRDTERIIATSFTGDRRFEVVGEPWMDPTQSFYLANVEIVDNRHEILPNDQMEDATFALFDLIPGLVQEWVDWMIKSEKLTAEEMNKRLKEAGPMPSAVTDRAMWVGRLVNPIPKLDVCMEIRPAMLACKNMHDRMILASAALKSSIDLLKETKRQK